MRPGVGGNSQKLGSEFILGVSPQNPGLMPWLLESNLCGSHFPKRGKTRGRRDQEWTRPRVQRGIIEKKPKRLTRQTSNLAAVSFTYHLSAI